MSPSLALYQATRGELSVAPRHRFATQDELDEHDRRVIEARERLREFVRSNGRAVRPLDESLDVRPPLD